MSRSQYYRYKSPKKFSDPRTRFDYSHHFRVESPHRRGRFPGRCSFGRSDSRHASSRDRRRSNSRDHKRRRKDFASKSDKFSKSFRPRKYRKFSGKSDRNFAGVVTYSIDEKDRYYTDPYGEWYEDSENMSDSANYNSDVSEHPCVSSVDHHTLDTDEGSRSENEGSQSSAVANEVDDNNVIGTMNSAQVRFDTLPIRGEHYCGMALASHPNHRCSSECRCESHSKASVHQDVSPHGDYFTSALVQAYNRKAAGARAPSSRSTSPGYQSVVDSSGRSTRLVGSASIAVESDITPTIPVRAVW